MTALNARIWIDNRPTELFRAVKTGDIIQFLCNGRGRGGHYRVTVRVTKLNRKTLQAIEQNRSYKPGTPWTIHFDTDMEIHEKSPEWLEKYADPVFHIGDEIKVDKIDLYHGGRTGKVISEVQACGRYQVAFYRQTGLLGPQVLKKLEK